MNRQQLISKVISEYRNIYPDWSDVRVRESYDNFGGVVTLVTSKMSVSTNENEELCYVYPDGNVKIFSSTAELLTFFQIKAIETAKPSLLERIVAKPVIAGFVFVFVLVGLFMLALFHVTIDAQVLACLTSLVGVAAGFFFGSVKTDNSN